MLIKVGSLYLTIGTFIFERRGLGRVYFAGQTIELLVQDANALEAILDKAIADQTTLQSQIEAVQKQGAELNEKMQQLAVYEKDLMQKAAQVDAAYAAMQQQKSPVIVPPGFGRKRG